MTKGDYFIEHDGLTDEKNFFDKGDLYNSIVRHDQ